MSALYAYTPELYPTRIRGTGSGITASIGRVAGIIAPTLYAYGGLDAAFTVFALTHFFDALAVMVWVLKQRKWFWRKFQSNLKN